MTSLRPRLPLALGGTGDRVSLARGGDGGKRTFLDVGSLDEFLKL